MATAMWVAESRPIKLKKVPGYRIKRLGNEGYTLINVVSIIKDHPQLLKKTPSNIQFINIAFIIISIPSLQYVTSKIKLGHLETTHSDTDCLFTLSV